MALTAIVFDLDDTLLDTTHLLLPIAKTPAFADKINQPLPLMDGARENLEYLGGKYSLYLLTFGDPKIQESKVRSMGIEKYFFQVFFADPSKSESKFQYFKKIKLSLKLTDAEFLSIGNRRSTDIRDAKKNGGLTCLFKYGEHSFDAIQQPEDHPDFEITHHQQLISKCQL